MTTTTKQILFTLEAADLIKKNQKVLVDKLNEVVDQTGLTETATQIVFEMTVHSYTEVER